MYDKRSSVSASIELTPHSWFAIIYGRVRFSQLIAALAAAYCWPIPVRKGKSTIGFVKMALLC
ncbi:hypothetical protein A9P79_28140 (plasmid) [Cupriavidus taiwanensis]|nr:hypothetical protein A9P79_28140 [Cupriavidus taiwanensis]